MIIIMVCVCACVCVCVHGVTIQHTNIHTKHNSYQLITHVYGLRLLTSSAVVCLKSSAVIRYYFPDGICSRFVAWQGASPVKFDIARRRNASHCFT